MSPSSNGDSPHSVTATMTTATSATVVRQYPMPSRDFTVDIPPPQLPTAPNGANTLKSPNSLKAAAVAAAAAGRAPNFSREGILGSAQKARNLSQSSDNRPESVLNGIPKSVSEESINPLKRRNTDAAVDYPRRRATIAVGRIVTKSAQLLFFFLSFPPRHTLRLVFVSPSMVSSKGPTNSCRQCEVCRSRKSRCDGTKPKCKLCTELGAECIYREPGIKLDAGDKLILERLNRIENLLQMNMVGQGNGINLSHGDSPNMSNGTALSGDNLMVRDANNNFVSIIPSGGLGTWSATATNISTMPKVHTNAALHLLQWPLIRDLVSRPYDPQILLQLEMAREPLHSLAKTPCVDLSNTNAYIEAYFDRVNIWYACVNPYTWRSHYRIALSNGFREGPESCIVLLVLSLGQASLRGSISRIVPHEDPPGLQYFTAAWSLLPGMMTSNSVLAAQCHLLAAAYLFYLVRPLEAWNLLCTTSTKLQLLLMTPNRVPADQRELIERIYWNSLLFESDLLAELDLPHSGVVAFEENVGLPCGFEGDEQEAVGRDELWYFLAEVALRRLLNRVSQLIYSKDSMASTTSLEPVVAELDFQLTQWYESLPVPLQFPFTRTMLPDPVQTVLRLRFFACRTIIYRPYILAVLDNEQAILDPAVRDSCTKCLEASVRQLEHITAQ